MKIICAHCQKEADKDIGHINRAVKLGKPMFCCKQCFYDSRKIERTVEEKRAIKAEYDSRYRKRSYIKQKRAESFKRNYNPIKQAAINKARMPKHIEYCRQPKYKEYKRQYDTNYRAKKQFGEFWESALLVNKIQSLYDDNEVRQINNLHNKSQKRKRLWQRNQK